ncbi:MAG: hypothetical protein EA397_05640 [Deltaproteobacteria bacterium]|nr:MAG: hypothetical protein EA397_05640 [Deltaproteobacteria bacterium]
MPPRSTSKSESRWKERRKTVRAFMGHPLTEATVVVLILISVGLLVVELAFAEDSAALMWLESINYLITAIFVVELSLRYWVAKSKRRFFKTYWIDIIALLPVVRPLRMLRVLRLLRLWHAGRLLNRRLRAFGGVFSAAVTELTTLITISAVVVLSSAAVLHLGDPDTFDTIDESLWFALLSLIAGEPIGIEPESQLGRWGTLILMLAGMVIMAMFIGTVAAGMGAKLAKRMEGPDMALDELEDHVVVCGWNGSAPTVLNELFALGTPKSRNVVVITEGPIPSDFPTEELPLDRLFHVVGDWTRLEMLESVGIRAASACILLRDVQSPRSDQDRDARTVLAALTIEMANPQIYTVAELHSSQSERMLKMRGVEEVVVGELYAGMILGSASRNPGLVAMLQNVLDMRQGHSFWSVSVPERFAGKPVGELRRELHDKHGATLMSIEPLPVPPTDGPTPSKVTDPRGIRGVQVNPSDSLELRTGDIAIVVADRELRL